MRGPDGWKAERRTSAGQNVNFAEMRAFQSGEKKIAVITQAASVGISLHADARQAAKLKDSISSSSPSVQQISQICANL